MRSNQLPDADWYQRQSNKYGTPAHCPIAANDKCPRYFASLQHIELILPGALSLESSQVKQLEKQWEVSDASCNLDLGVSISGDKEKGIHQLGGFCPEVSAIYLQFYCSDFREFADG